MTTASRTNTPAPTARAFTLTAPQFIKAIEAAISAGSLYIATSDDRYVVERDFDEASAEEHLAQFAAPATMQPPATAPAVYRRWKLLDWMIAGDEVKYVMAACVEDGIGVIARWRKDLQRGWSVAIIDTEGQTANNSADPIPDELPAELIEAIAAHRSYRDRLGSAERTSDAAAAQPPAPAAAAGSDQ